MPAFFAVLADAILLLHLGFILFVVAGGLIVNRWPRARWPHLAAILWALFVTFGDVQCPLTPLEQGLRRLSGATPYSEGFIEHYLLPLLYPDWLMPPTRIGIGFLVVFVNLAIYAGMKRRPHPPGRGGGRRGE